MVEFAKYRLKRSGPRVTSVIVRLAKPNDAQAIAKISEAGDEDAADHLREASREIEQQDAGDASKVVFVADVGATVVGFARAGYLVPPDAVSENCVPEGWYLKGLTVMPDHRGRGIGSFLTQSRLDWLAGRTNVVRYFVNSRNWVAIELHKKLGFREVRRDIWVPKVTFSGGGTGILYELTLERRPSISRRMSN